MYAVGFKLEDGGWYAQVLGCMGCMAWAETFPEARKQIVETFTTWSELKHEDKSPMPEPPGSIWWEEWDIIMPLQIVQLMT